MARSIGPITPGLIHRSFLETKLHICLKLRSAIGFCFSMHAHGSCPEHRTIPALPLLEKNCRFAKNILLMFITNVLNVDHCENASFYVCSLLFNPTSDERFLKGSQYTILPLYMSLTLPSTKNGNIPSLKLHVFFLFSYVLYAANYLLFEYGFTNTNVTYKLLVIFVRKLRSCDYVNKSSSGKHVTRL